MTVPSQLTPAIEVFRAAPSMHRPSWSQLLNDAERAKIARLRRREDRARAVTARVLLRLVVANYLGCSPSEVVFEHRCAVCGGAHGKPEARVPRDARPVETSVSYSGSVVLVAIADVPIGIDVERCAATGFAGFDTTALSAAERVELDTVAPADRPGVRTALWTAKEAILKIGGLGLSVSPSSVHVGRCGRPGVVSVDTALALGGAVAVADVPVAPDYRARVACHGDRRPIVVMRDADALLAGPGAVARTATV